MSLSRRRSLLLCRGEAILALMRPRRIGCRLFLVKSERDRLHIANYMVQSIDVPELCATTPTVVGRMRPQTCHDAWRGQTAETCPCSLVGTGKFVRDPGTNNGWRTMWRRPFLSFSFLERFGVCVRVGMLPSIQNVLFRVGCLYKVAGVDRRQI